MKRLLMCFAFRLTGAFALSVLFMTTPAAAVPIVVSSGDGAIVDITGLDLRDDEDDPSDLVHNTTVFGGIEKQNVTVAENQVWVDHLIGSGDVGSTLWGVGDTTADHVLPAGSYDSYLLYYNPVNTGHSGAVEFTFAGDILAIMSGFRGLRDTNDEFAVSARQHWEYMETDDSFTITSANSLSSSGWWVGGSLHCDQLRVLTTPTSPGIVVPEPCTMAFMASALAGLVGWRRRKARAQ